MPLISASHDSLPYIDPPPTPSDLTTITALITSSLPPHHATTPHPSLPALPTPTFTPTYLSTTAPPPTGGIDLTRYDPAEGGSAATASSLRAAYASAEHLRTRLANLTLLNGFGKNAWLVHNSQLEALLKGLEEELVAAKEECESVNKERKGMQVGVKAELEALQERWRKGVGRALEVEAGAEMVRMEVLRRRREGVDGGGSE